MQVVVSGSRLSRGRWCHVEPRPSTPIGLVVKRGVIRGYHDVGSEDLRS
jgi:hypothetical protein